MNHGPSFQSVSVVDLSADGTYAVVSNAAGATFNVMTHVRFGGVSAPQVGETWLVNRPFGQWSFAAKIDPDPMPVITAGPEGESPLVLQLLAAMTRHGLVSTYQQTLEDVLGYTGFDVAASVWDTGITDDVPDLPSTDQDGDGDPSTPDTTPQGRYHDLWVASWNCGGTTRTSAALRSDLTRLVATRADLIGVQEFVGQRDSLLAFMEAQGFACLRDETQSEGGGPQWNTTFYRTKALALQDQGNVKIADRPASGTGVSRWARWGQFKHADSGVTFSHVTTHLSPPSRNPASYYTDQVAAVAALIDARWTAGGATLLSGSVNADYRDAATLTRTGYPYAVWEAHSLYPCWDYTVPPTTYGTFGQPVVDGVWRRAVDGQAVVRRTSVLTGYGSAHKPVLSQVQMRRKGHGAT